MTLAGPLLPAGLCHMDEDEKALAALPNLADRMTYHTKRLRLTQYVSGAEGVAVYKAKHPEARTIQTRATTIAFQPKPQGYTDFLCGLVDTWFISDVALTETNKAAVARLNEAMHPRRFNPDNHFSKPVSGTLLGKLADVFVKHGAHLDTSKPLSMAKVRAAVKAAKGKRSAGRPFGGGLGHITDGQLIIGDHSFTLQLNGNRQCIRPTINGSKRRLYLDELEWMLSLYPSYEIRIGDGDYSASDPSEPDPLANALPESGPNDLPLPLRERDYFSDTPLSQRIAAMRVAREAEEEEARMRAAAYYDDDVDPLARAH